MKLKSFFAFFVSVLVAISLIACTDPTTPPETPTPTISVADITLQEDEVKDIVVVFDPEDATEDYEYASRDIDKVSKYPLDTKNPSPEITEGEEFISIRNDKVTGILAGVATVKVTTAPSQLTTTFKVTVTPDPTDPIEKFNIMGGFESASVKDLGWIESTAGQMAPDGEYKRTGDLSLKIYGGWDEGTKTNLTFDYTISAYLRRVPAGEYTLSYYRQGGVQTEIKINDTVYEMNWTHKEEAGWNHYVCYFDLEEQSNISISFHFVADEESDNDTERWAVIDDISIIPYKYVKMTLPSIIELDLNPDAESTFAVIDESIYTILPELPEGEEIEDFALTIDPTTTAVTIEGVKIIAAEKGEAEITVSFKAYGKDFSETITVWVVNSAEDPILVGIYKQTVDKINEIGGFETDDWEIATLGFANYVDDDSIAEAYTAGDWKRSGEMAYKFGEEGLPAGKKISIYLDGLYFWDRVTYSLKFYTALNGIQGSVKIFQSLDGVNPYTDEGLYAADIADSSEFMEQTFEFTPSYTLNDVVLIFVFENTIDETLYGCLDDISITFEIAD